MSTIAATTDETIWKCDSCEALASSVNAFTVPRGWWQLDIQRRTEGGRLKRGRVDACGKECVLHALKWSNGTLVPYV